MTSPAVSRNASRWAGPLGECAQASTALVDDGVRSSVTEAAAGRMGSVHFGAPVSVMRRVDAMMAGVVGDGGALGNSLLVAYRGQG